MSELNSTVIKEIAKQAAKQTGMAKPVADSGASSKNIASGKSIVILIIVVVMALAVLAGIILYKRK
ncbi:MAG: hypothetical protein LBL04_13925 [Bacteroidales bacterium]|jgi:hypothetical protein|nr:hypothetical protein [Bacteroidales bacterium]